MSDEYPERRRRESGWVVTWRFGTALLSIGTAAICGYATLWVQANAPTRPEFLELARTVQGIREDLLVRGTQEQRLRDHEDRLRKLEDESRRRFPPGKRPGEL